MNDPVYVHILVVSKLFLFNRGDNVLNIYKILVCRIKYAKLNNDIIFEMTLKFKLYSLQYVCHRCI